MKTWEIIGCLIGLAIAGNYVYQVFFAHSKGDPEDGPKAGSAWHE